ncbi:uncharacterized protein LOC128884042 isoform X2 [Hylaeus volcanicus]|uniref:uncharacterized protein LOC128884042 isoform X2 n=1 Tax=Hylaeus volcanicus TaxID=313075 RepID=UPI0023B7FBDE|nr:uncharacterized protein LOC128884042 isoform X2 [Hylaeus volcanicus]
MSVQNVSQAEKKELPTPSVQNGSQAEEKKLPTQVDIKVLNLQKTCCCCLLDMINMETSGMDATLTGFVQGTSNRQTLALIGLINCCSHTFHFKCILAWSSQENSCPQCKRRFTFLAGYSCVDGVQHVKRRVAHVDQHYKPQAFRPPTVQRVQRQQAQQNCVSCFLCFSIYQDLTTETLQNEWLQCSGDHGVCRVACHQFCFDQLTFPLSISNELRSLWFCPFCIRENRCVTAQRQRALDCTAFLREINLPSFSSTRSFTFSSGADIIQPFIRFYRHMKYSLSAHKGKRKRLTTLEKNKKSLLSNGASQKKKKKSSYDAFVCSSEDDLCHLTPPPYRGSTDDFQRYELNQRQKFGQEQYGKSMYSSRTDDGGILSGRDFVASLFRMTSSPTNVTTPSTFFSSSSSSSRQMQDQLVKDLPPSNSLMHETTGTLSLDSEKGNKQKKPFPSIPSPSSTKILKPHLLTNKKKKKPSPTLLYMCVNGVAVSGFYCEASFKSVNDRA